MVDFPATAFPNLEKKDFFVVESPLFNCSFFSELNTDFKKLMFVAIKKATVKVAYILDRRKNYFLLNQSLAIAGATMVSTKE
jgi:hypothetical protein